MPLTAPHAHRPRQFFSKRTIVWASLLSASIAILCGVASLLAVKRQRSTIPKKSHDRQPQPPPLPAPPEEPEVVPRSRPESLPIPREVKPPGGVSPAQLLAAKLREQPPPEEATVPDRQRLLEDALSNELLKEELAAELEKLQFSLDPEIALELEIDEVRTLSEEIREQLRAQIGSSPGFDPKAAARLAAEIKEHVAPDPDQEALLTGILSSLNVAERLPSGTKPNREFRGDFFRDVLGGGYSYSPEKADPERELWCKILRALGCHLSDSEAAAVGESVLGLRRRAHALQLKFRLLELRSLRCDGLDPTGIGAHRRGLLDDLCTLELERLWPEFQRAFSENLSPENLEAAARFFRAFGVWTEE